MERIRKLPFLSGCMGSVLAGIISLAAGADKQTIYIRMAAMMLVFFILGIYIRNTIYSIKRQNEERQREKELEEELKQKKMKEEKIAEAMSAKTAENRAKLSHTIDMTAGNNQDGFEPLDFAKAVKTKAKE